MHTERCNPFIHVTFGWSSKKNLSLDEAGLLAEYNLECKLLFSFILTHLGNHKIIKWFEILWLKILFFFHFINLEID